MTKKSQNRGGRSFRKKRMVNRSSKMTRKRNVMKMYGGFKVTNLLAVVMAAVATRQAKALGTGGSERKRIARLADENIRDKLTNESIETKNKLDERMKERGFSKKDQQSLHDFIFDRRHIIQPYSAEDFNNLSYHDVTSDMQQSVLRGAMLEILDGNKDIKNKDALVVKMAAAPPENLRLQAERQLKALGDSMFNFILPFTDNVREQLGFLSYAAELEGFARGPVGFNSGF